WLIEYTDADFQRQDDRGRSCLKLIEPGSLFSNNQFTVSISFRPHA
ncbi:unnamed protein product, partial [Adineta steineri]